MQSLKKLNLQFSDEENADMQKFLYSQRVSNRVMMLADLPDSRKTKKRKVVPENYEDKNDYEKDLIKKLDKQNQKKVRFVYGDGQKRNFGQTLGIRIHNNRMYKFEAEFGEKQVKCKDARQFLYEGKRDFTPYNAPKSPRYQTHNQKQWASGHQSSGGPSGGGPVPQHSTRGKGKMSYPSAPPRDYRSKGEDTRSLYDDPKLQRLRQTYTRRLLMKIDQDYEKVEGCSWQPVSSNDQLPESYYMNSTFKERVGPQNVNEKLINTEYDAFKLFFCDKVYGNIIRASKEKYQQNFLEQVQAYCHGYTTVKPQYYDFNLHERELDAYFAVQLFFGIVRLSNMHDYWKQSRRQTNYSKDEHKLDRKRRNLVQYQQADDNYTYYIQQKMATILSLSRFQEIRYNLSLSGIEAKRNHPNDILYRVRDFITDLNEKFKLYYYPDEFLCVDEGMIPFGGKAKFKVYNPDKPTQWGIKEYLLCDALRSYTLHIQIYHGQSTWDRELKQKMLLEDEQDIQSRTMELVLSLLKNYEGKGHKVIMDNYYTSWQLLRELKNRGIGALGTIRHNRTGLGKQDILKEHFQQIYQDSYKRYAFYVNSTKDSILLYFQGTADKEVAMITNFLDHSCNEEHKFAISKRHYYVPNVKLPYMISQYNKYKGGVDRRNAYTVMFRSRFSCRKWWQAIFERFFETAIYNAFQIYKQIHRVHLLYKRGLFRDFRVNLMRLLSERYQEHKQKVKEGTECENLKRTKLDPHTFIEGCEQIECEQCGAITNNFCQECTVIQSKVIAVCNELTNVKCQRFHTFKDYLIDKDQVVISRKFKYVPWDPSSVVDFYQEVGQLQKQRRKLKQERTQLITENYNKKVTAENLQNIITVLKQLQGKEVLTAEDRKRELELKKLIQEQLILLKATKLEVKVPPIKEKHQPLQASPNHLEERDKKDTKCSKYSISSDEDVMKLQDDNISFSSFNDSNSEDQEVKDYKNIKQQSDRNRSMDIPSNQVKKDNKQQTKFERFYAEDMEEVQLKKQKSEKSKQLQELEQKIMDFKNNKYPYVNQEDYSSSQSE